MNRLPEPTARQPHATTAGQPTINDNATKFLADLESAYETHRTQQPTAIRVDDPTIPTWADGTRTGTTPPVTNQPGTRRPPMSERAVDLNVTLISTSVVITALGAATTGILWASGHANPTIVGWVCTCIVAVPAALAIPILALKGLMKSAKDTVEAAPPVIHHNYNGPVTINTDQRTVNSTNVGFLAVNRNQTPPTQLPPAN